MQNIAIFASGTGTNARRIIEYFNANQRAQVTLLVCNKPDAPVVQLAEHYKIDFFIISNKIDFQNPNTLLEKLSKNDINFIVLAGFLWLVPEALLQAYPNRIINIHPALLPKFGGKGMYGMNVHRSVFAAKEKITGISIHLIDEAYDRGEILFQASCTLDENDTPESIADKVRTLEHEHFASVIDAFLQKKLKKN